MNESQKAPSEKFVAVPILDAVDETARVRRLVFALPPELAAAHERPGQLIRARSSAGESVYALGNAPGQGRGELLLKRGHAAADALLAESGGVRGGELWVGRPFGKGFPVDKALDDDALLFAVGSAIAPLHAVLEWLRVRRRRGRTTLFYGERGVDDFAYRADFAAWRAAGIEVVLCSSRAEGESEVRGYVHEVARSRAVDGLDPSRTVAFVCGMKPMIAAVRALLSEGGLPDARVFLNF